MKRLIRILVLVGVASVAVAGGYFLVRGGEEEAKPAAGDPSAFPVPDSNRTCGECHPEIYAQWERSFHALAWDDPQLQVPGIRLKEKPDCWPCHIPGPIHLSKLGMLPQARAIRRSEGVGCIACHYTLKGMAGKVTDPSPPCRPVTVDDMATMKICSGCHNQHKTHDEWRTSRFFPKENCNHCHMPTVEGEPTKGKGKKKYRAHTWPGCHDLKTLREAFTLEASVDEDWKALVVVRNNGAGHNFPTDARFHRADLKVDVILPSGEIVSQFEEKYKNPFRSEFGMPNTQIKPGEKKTYHRRLTLPDGVTRGVLRVRILYCLQPWPGKTDEKLEDTNHVPLEEIRVPFER